MADVITDREKEILTALSNGHIVKEISDMLNISFHTVETHKKNAMRKMKARTTTQLVSLAIRSGKIA